ncbi:glycosyltransferase family 4 protein [Labilibaculum euxinus]
MMKILMVGPGPKTRGGISAVISAYQNSSIWQDFNITWIDTYYDKSVLTKLSHFFKGLIAFLYKIPKADLVHIHLSEPVSAFRKLVFFLVGKLFLKPIILHLHSFDSKTSVGGRFKSQYRFLFSKADTIIVLSPYWENEVKKNIPNCRTKVIFNPCSKILKLDLPKEKIILFAGTLNQRKGYALLIESFGQIAKKYPDWKLVFAGNGEIERGKELANKFNISYQTEFLGWISGDEKNEIFSKAMIFCLPSYAEGFPMAILDAYSYGLPVVSTTCGRIDLVLKDNEDILFFEMGNVNALANCLDNLMSNEKLSQKVGNNGFQFSKNNFELEVVVNELKMLYKSI